MLWIRVELHSAITGQVTEIARMGIYNDGEGTHEVGHYKGKATKGIGEPKPPQAAWDSPTLREGEVKNYRRQSLHVWNLVARMLQSMGYK